MYAVSVLMFNYIEYTEGGEEKHYQSPLPLCTHELLVKTYNKKNNITYI